MTENRGNPCIGRMAYAALLRRLEVIRRLTGCRRAIVAGGTGTQHLRMVHFENRGPDGRAMAVFANVGGLRMLRILASSVDAVMAANAVAGNVGVIESRRSPGDGGMAIVTVISAGNMGPVLAGCRYAIVTGATGTQHLRVVNGEYRRKCIGGMTVVTDVCRGDVLLVLADCIGAVVTGVAGTEDLRMVNRKYRRKCIGGMAVLTDVRCRHVPLVLAGRVRAVMTGETIPRDIRMIEGRRKPASRRVAIVAGIPAGHVVRCLASGNNAVMTVAADAVYLGVINGKHGRKYVGGVAVLADIARRYVLRILAGSLRAVMAAYTVTGDIQVIEVCRQPASR